MCLFPSKCHQELLCWFLLTPIDLKFHSAFYHLAQCMPHSEYLINPCKMNIKCAYSKTPSPQFEFVLIDKMLLPPPFTLRIIDKG